MCCLLHDMCHDNRRGRFFFSFPRTLVTPVKVRNELYHRSEDLDFVRPSWGKSVVTLPSGASRLILSSSEV